VKDDDQNKKTREPVNEFPRDRLTKSVTNHFVTLNAGYDDTSQPEEKKFSRLLNELLKISEYTRLMLSGGKELSRVSDNLKYPLDSYGRSESDGLIKDDVEYERKKPPSNAMWCQEKSRTQYAMAFESTVSTRECDVSLHSQRLRYSIGGAYTRSWDCDSTAARDSAGPKIYRRNIYWPPGIYWPDVGWLETWESVLVESVRRVLQRWRGVCSFSLTMRSIESDEESHLMVGRRSKKQRRYEG